MDHGTFLGGHRAASGIRGLILPAHINRFKAASNPLEDPGSRIKFNLVSPDPQSHGKTLVDPRLGIARILPLCSAGLLFYEKF